jgi:hypothetical protein
MKDTVRIQFKRAADFKDSASAELPDPNQAEMDFKAGPKKPKADPSAHEDEDDDIPITTKALPAPSKGLPEPIEAEIVDGDDKVEGEEE